MKPSFIRNIFLRLAITLPVSFSGLIVLPLLTRLYTQDIYGAWLQIILIKGLLINLLSLRLETALVRYLPGEKDKQQLIKAVITVTCVISVLFISMLYLFQDEVSQLIFGGKGFANLLMIASFWITINACMQIGLETLRSQEKIVTLSIREVLSALWLIGAAILVYLTKLDVQALILICIAGDSIILMWILFQIDVPVPVTSLFKSICIVSKYLPYSVPLIFNSLFLWFTGSIDRLIIVNLLGLAAVGVYGVALQVTQILSVIWSPITFVLFPRSVSVWDQNNREEVNQVFSQALSLTLMLSLPAIIGIFVVSQDLVTLLAGQNYKTSNSLVAFLLLAGLTNVIYSNHIFIIHLVEKTIYLPVLFISTAIINYVLCYIFVLKLGITGAAIARFITYGIMALIVTIWGRRYVKITIPWRTILKVLLAAIIMGVIMSWMPMNTWLKLSGVVMLGFIVYTFILFIVGVLKPENLKILKEAVEKPQ